MSRINIGKYGRWAASALAVLALLLSVITHVATPGERLDNLAGIAAAGDGQTWIAIYRGREIEFSLLRPGGTVQRSFRLPRTGGGQTAQITAMQTDEEGTLYILRSYTGAEDGAPASHQELTARKSRLLPFGRMKTIRLEAEPAPVRYQDLQVSTSLILTGVSEDGSEIHRTAYDREALADNGLAVIKSERAYGVDPSQGVYRPVATGVDAAYISMTGRVYAAEENQQPRLLFPEEGSASYAAYICGMGENVVIGERRGGGILRIATADGRLEYLKEGSQSFGSLPYTAQDVLAISFAGEDTASFSALVQASGGGFALVVSREGALHLVERIAKGPLATLGSVLAAALLYGVLMLAAVGIVAGLRRGMRGSRRIFVKLVFASVPLLVAALALFGVYSGASYKSSLSSTYETKVADQGNLLRALFSSSSFDMIASPGMYHSAEYKYLRLQMGTRDVYTSSAYFVDRALYTGVDWRLPALYPFGIRYSGSAEALYREAALTGKQRTGVIEDALGRRIACVTPVGSSSGDTVFLLETGIFQAEIDRQVQSFVRNYLITAAACLIIAAILLMLAFRRILDPLRDIIGGLETFSRGDRSVRLSGRTNDELADITRVFNKMASDIDATIYNLRGMSETYYRFVPQQIFQLLGKENLADLELGSSVTRPFHILAVNLKLRPARAGAETVRDMTNRFFTIVHRAAGENGATLLSDSANLRTLWLICPGGAAALTLAMDAIAGVDSANTRSDITQRIDVSFLLHATTADFSICGDEQRYIPALISSEMEQVLACCKHYRSLGSRLLVTEPAYGGIDRERYLHRYIGAAEDSRGESIGLYDFYDCSAANLIRLTRDTQPTFDKAMALYEQRRYYDAKNLFTTVLRDNQYDNVARHYVFQCEKKL